MKNLLLLLFFCLATFPAQAGELSILTEEDAPLNFTRDGEVTGISGEIVKEIMRRLEIKASIEVLPWARAYPRLRQL